MCCNPIKIKNKTTHYRSGIDQIELLVPCGKCPECRTSMHNDWFLRAYAHALDYWERGGIVIFATLTYDNEHLPYHIDKLGKYSFKFPCFDKKDVDTFLSKLRTYCQRQFGIAREIDYLVTCEYGTLKGRPHYHLLLYLPKELANLYDWQIKNVIQKAWIYGFVGWTPYTKGGPRITSENGIKYVAKYVTKDLSFYADKKVKFYFDLLGKKSEIDEERRKLIVRHSPRHRQSIGFGYNVLARCFAPDKVLDTLKNGYRPPLSLNCYRIPRYIFNKLCYHDNIFGAHVLNEFGRKVFAMKQELLLNDMVRKFESTFYPDRLNEIAISCDLYSLGFDSATHCCEYVHSLLGDRTWLDLATYNMVYRGRHMEQFHPDLNLDGAEINELTALGKSLRVYALYRDMDIPDIGKDLGDPIKMHIGIPQREKELLFNSHPAFEKFDDILHIYEYLTLRHSQRKAAAKNTKDTAVKKLRDYMFNN